MGVRENKVERYLNEQVVYWMLGETRAWKKSNRDGVMDQIVFLRRTGVQHFVEVKTADGVRSPEQEREAMRLRKLGATVTCVYGYAAVDAYIEDVKNGNEIKEVYK